MDWAQGRGPEGAAEGDALLLERVLDLVGDGVVIADGAGLVLSLNPVAEQLTGWSMAEAIGQPVDRLLPLVDETTAERLPDLAALCLADGETRREDEAVLPDRYGEGEAWVNVTVNLCRMPGGEDRLLVTLRDVTEQLGMARVMFYQANHDALTGLVNRKEFETRLWHALENTGELGRPHALCYLDLDQLQLLNDTCGQLAGDELLKQVADLLQDQVRDSDTVARLGGDDFAILLYGCPMDEAKRLAGRLSTAVAGMGFAWGGQPFPLSASLGLVALDDDHTPGELLAAAEAACDMAQEGGQGQVRVVRAGDRLLAERHGEMQWTRTIRNALDEDRFCLRMQRIDPLKPGLPQIGEVLVSLVSPEGEPVAPGAFLPAAERYQLMRAIDSWVVTATLEALADGGTVLSGLDLVNINLSGQSLGQPGFMDDLVKQLARTGVDPRRICLEITETAVIRNLSHARLFMRALRGRGCRFALDDFGSGLSSFGYLRKLPVDYVKIDGQFVRNMVRDSVDRSMVESIHNVAQVMGLRTIAEFVEDDATLRALRALGVTYGQGFGLHRPEPV